MTGNGVRSPRPHTTRQASDIDGAEIKGCRLKTTGHGHPQLDCEAWGGHNTRLTRQPPTGHPHTPSREARHTLSCSYASNRESAQPPSNTKPHTDRNTYTYSPPCLLRHCTGRGALDAVTVALSGARCAGDVRTRIRTGDGCARRDGRGNATGHGTRGSSNGARGSARMLSPTVGGWWWRCCGGWVNVKRPGTYRPGDGRRVPGRGARRVVLC